MVDQLDPGGKVSSYVLDRIFQPLLGQANPAFAPAPADGSGPPGLSIPIITKNFRRFSARVGAVFEVQNRVIAILTWQNPYETASVLAIFSFVCLYPFLLPILPIGFIIFTLLIPAYYVRHPTASYSLFPTNSGIITETVEPISPPPQPAPPVPELSRDFFLNMRDIQNFMADFSDAYDLLRGFIVPITNFSQESLSSTLLSFGTLFTLLYIPLSPLIPWRWILVFAGNATVIACHPLFYHTVKTYVLSSKIISVYQTQLENFVEEDYIHPLPAVQVSYPVEIFEFQHLTVSKSAESRTPEWSNSVFSPFPTQIWSSSQDLASVTPPPGYTYQENSLWKTDPYVVKWMADRNGSMEKAGWSVNKDNSWAVNIDEGKRMRRWTRSVIALGNEAEGTR